MTQVHLVLFVMTDLLFYFLETKEWLQPEVSGDLPKARGQHSVAVVGDKLVLYGGSSDFSPEVMACQKYYNDTYVLPIGDYFTV